MQTFQLNHCSVDLADRKVRWPEGPEHSLTQLEAGLLEHLVARAGRVASRDELLERVWGYDAKVVSRAVDTTVKRVRQKIEVDPANPEHLLTEWGTGYRLVGLRTGEQAPPPIGDLVLVCSVVVGARHLHRDEPEAWAQSLGVFSQLAREELADSGGYLVRQDADEILAAFSSCRHAVEWCLDVQERLHRAQWPPAILAHPEGEPIEIDAHVVLRGLRVAMAIHQGGARAITNADSGRVEYAGTGVRTVRALAADTAPGAIRAEFPIFAASGTSLVFREVHGTARLDAFERAFEGRSRVATTRGRVRTSIFGRSAEIEQLTASLQRHRMVTILGPGGVGKTTLATELAAALDRAPSRWRFVALEQARTEEELVSAIADALPVELSVPDLQAGVEWIGAALADRSLDLLLILDNLEQLPPGIAGILQSWLERAPRLWILGTSRRPVGVVDEDVFALGPLGLQASVGLLSARIRVARGGVPCTDDEVEHLEVIAKELEGIPLALELAAARAPLLGVEGIRTRIGDSLRLLARGPAKVSRHQSMTEAIAWSWALLEPWEAAAMSQLSVFTGPFSAAAAEAVVDLSSWPNAPWTLDVLDDLQRHSLIRTTDSATDPRLTMLVPIRQYAERQYAERQYAERQSDDPAPAMLRMARFLAGRGDPEWLDALDGPDEGRRRTQLAAEAPDLQRAVDWAFEEGRHDLAARCWLALAHYFDRFAPAGPTLARWREPDPGLDPLLAARCTLSLGRLRRQARGAAAALEDFERAVERARTVDDARVLGRACAWLYLVRFECGHTASETVLLEAIEASRRAGDAPTEAFAGMLRGVSMSMAGRADTSVELLEDALAIARSCGATSLRGRILTNLGSSLHARGRLERAARTYDAALPLHERAGNRRSLGCLHINRGNLAVADGRLDDAIAEFDQALRILRANANPMEEGIALLNLGQLYVVRGQLDSAQRNLERAIRLSRRTDNRPSLAYATTNLADVARLRGDLVEAERLAREAIAIHREAAHPQALSGALLVHAEILWALGDPKRSGDLARQVLDLNDGLETPQLQGRAWLLQGRAIAEQGGDPTEVLDRARRLLLEARDQEGIGLVWAARAQGGDPIARTEAERVAAALGAGPDSSLGRAISRTRTRPGP